ncbi:hypothetical protein Ciccas_004353 [Cichlidogyrus casuarinus]|uniref:Uncharacterized protein n=1 Tax=Cichlidogyrus casuarinus TaxID=1844966 RepID=A0ABD2QBR7_9PLAT
MDDAISQKDRELDDRIRQLETEDEDWSLVTSNDSLFCPRSVCIKKSSPSTVAEFLKLSESNLTQHNSFIDMKLDLVPVKKRLLASVMKGVAPVPSLLSALHLIDHDFFDTANSTYE